MLEGFEDGFAEVNGVRLHYVTGGSGAPLALLPAWPRTWWQFDKIMPALAERYSVIAVEYRGMGESDKPESGYDKKTMARDVYELVRSLGHDRINIAGEDIGGMVAYSFAANHPEATIKAAILEAVHPSEGFYGFPILPAPDSIVYPWWWALAQIKGIPEEMLAGKYRLMIDNTIEHHSDHPERFSDEVRERYANAYNSRDAIRASNAWFSSWVSHDILDEKTYGPLKPPVLALNGRLGGITSDLLAGKAEDIRFVEIPNGGHFLCEEEPQQVLRELVQFFG